jgi:two-component system, chemotaxis family, protein-glutamate methylesterase/glutaminase
VLLAQHMPPVFTQILAKRISALINSDVKEASDRDLIKNDTFLVAPGDYHLTVTKTEQGVRAALNQGALRNSVRPAADHLFETASQVYGGGVLGIVLTGMGEDGAQGAEMIRKNGGRVLIQSKESCVVFGMPGAVYENDDYDQISSLEEITSLLKGILE